MINSAGCFQAEVLTLQQVLLLKQSLEDLPRKYFFYEEKNRRWGLRKIQPLSHLCVNPSDSWFSVNFGGNSEPLQENVTLPFRMYPNIETLQRTAAIGLRWMAEQKGWQNQTRQMSLSIMQHHHLHKDEYVPGIPWHRDNGRHTLIILLDSEQKWQGGDFLFRKGDGEPLRFQPKLGNGILFSNDSAKHCVEALRAIEENVDRTILTFHEKS